MHLLAQSCLVAFLLCALSEVQARHFARKDNDEARQPTRRAVSSGFVTTNGAQFELDGQPFYFVGANAYWLPLLITQEDVDATFATMAGAGVKVVRTWGFNAINATELDYALSSGLTYYQVWNNSEWTLNEGPQGLQRLDYVVQTAEQYGIKMIMTFTNNWVGYGGMELYIYHILGNTATHDQFYTNPVIIASYQSYVEEIVSRYKDSPAIFAWELMNEARCAGDSLPSGPNCVPGSETLTKWYQQQSDYVRSLDPYHMITTGGEGQFYWADPPTYWYDGQLVSDFNFNGEAGEDFEASLSLPNIDFGTYHMYPQTWYPELDYPGSNFSVEDWGLGWIGAHANTASYVGKPLLIEEFGVTGLDNKTAIYPVWVDYALATGHAIQPWQFGELGLTEDGGNRLIKYSDQIYMGASPNDGFTFYINQTSVWDVFTAAAVVQDYRF
ncbi:glycoside hydrolase family 5 protein [Laetiporus sulphureus 93-53]|uniref:mannan endo-1,4-beta-mannosidase n=1 Tax=Laetiporus sulphureus 93-53 TaxID=1314785 RepID=A0A165DZD8_9APHY|nr:glycoside hydrolase family 5 protein [Laetiporus sulphureus 93-53]KZT05949.1 glycoside hydrolase family 5 protein [Laetiporus sulphureus 93-53]